MAMLIIAITRVVLVFLIKIINKISWHSSALRNRTILKQTPLRLNNSNNSGINHSCCTFAPSKQLAKHEQKW
jgi:hypothetical protein